MPIKNPDDYKVRKEFIEQQVDLLLSDNSNDIHTVRQALINITENKLGYSIRHMYRIVKPQQFPVNPNQLTLKLD